MLDLIAVFVDHQAQLRRAALKILGDPARAEDVVQDAYLKVTESEGRTERQAAIGIPISDRP